MTDESRLLDELTEHGGVLRRVEIVRGRMRQWQLAPGDLGYIDVSDPTNLDPEHPLYVRADHPELAHVCDRMESEAHDPNVQPDDINELRGRAGLGQG
ncbi:MAG: hypothetical protein L0H41_17120 [Microlunatus sp.]|nr:hypothetical protein [Microlunatus sp.]MDN5771190.1 hypothetical protein [Microlunatus sp.]